VYGFPHDRSFFRINILPGSCLTARPGAVIPAIRSSTDSRAVRNSTHTAGGSARKPAQYLQAAEVRQHDIQHDVVSDQPVL